VAGGDTALARLAQNLATLVGNNIDGVGQIRAADPTAVLSHARGRGTLSAAQAIGIAKELGATSAVHGTIVRTGETVRIDALMFDVLAPDTPVARVTVTAPMNSVVAITDSLTMGLLRQVWSRGNPPTPHVTSITSRSPAALREFLNGEWLFAHGQFREAGDAFKRAVNADTSFWFAAYRYQVARQWMAEAVEDTSITQRLSRHRADLPERERALLAASDSSVTQSAFLRQLKALTLRYPDYAPAWQTIADYSVHNFQRSGYSVRDGIGMWREVQRLMPMDFPTTEHIATACVAAGDLECARAASARMDTLIRAETKPTFYMMSAQILASLAVAPMTPVRLDSILQAGIRNKSLTMLSRTSFIVGAPALVWQPGLLEYMDAATQRVIAVAPKTVIGPNEVAGYLLTRAARGEWAALDSAIRMQIQETNDPSRTSPIDLVRARVVAELEGAMTPVSSTVARMAARTEDPTLSASSRAEARWLIAANALARGDSSVVRAQLAAMSGDTSADSRIAARSLRGLALGLGGKRAAAAESLLALERQHGEGIPKVWGAFAIDRLFAAQWLTENERYAAADSLLEFTRGFIVRSMASAALPIYAATQLQRSRIAEAMGNRDEAIRYATIFVRAYDLSPDKHSAAMDEAQQRIARLGGKVDARRGVQAP
jgi:hypothetical protein